MANASFLNLRLDQGLAMIQSGFEIVQEVRENIEQGKAVLSDTDKASVMARLHRLTDESLALDQRIQRA